MIWGPIHFIKVPREEGHSKSIRKYTSNPCAKNDKCLKNKGLFITCRF